MKAGELLDHRFAMIAVKKGLISRDQFQAALKTQRLTRGKGEKSVSMGEILVKEGLLTEEALNEVLPPALKHKMVLSKGGGGDEARAADGDQAGFGRTEEDRLTIKISNDFLTAFLVCKGNARQHATPEEVKTLVQTEGVRFGLVDDEEIRRYLDSGEQAPNEWQIAQGKAPQPGTPDKVDYHFDRNPFRIGTVSEDGLMDWKDHGEIPQVHEDDLLAEITPGKKGKAGRNVLGKAIPAPEGKKARLKVGKGVKASEDRLKFYAAKGGQPKISIDDTLSVLSTLEIDGDIGIETGHVEFDGHIEVRGTIEKGYRIRGESLRAQEILSEDVEVGGDVDVSGGVFGAKIESGGRIRANHVNKSRLIAVDDVVIRKELVDSKVDTSGKCLIDGGTILYSEVSAKMGIKSGDIGSAASNASTISVGMDIRLKNAVKQFKAQVEVNQEEEESLVQSMEELTQKSNQINTELGEVAQSQDSKMVARRKIEERLEEEKRPATPEEAEQIAKLIEEEKQYDQIVAKMMDRDEQTLEERSRQEARIEEIHTENEEMNQAIEEAVARLKEEKGLANVHVSGTIYQLTLLKGPHATLVVPNDYTRVAIREEQVTDADDRKLWQFSIASK